MGQKESELCLALLETYVDHEGLANLLYIKLERHLAHIVAPATLPTTVRVIVETAEQGGWLEPLGTAALADKPDSEPLRAWNRKYRAPRPPEEPASPQQLMDSAYFDLTVIRDSIHEAMIAPASQVIGFGVTYTESKFVRKLSDWLHWYLGPQTQPMDPLSLNPATGNVPYRLDQLRRYRNLLDKVNLLCEVVVDGAATAAHVAEFWERAGAEFREGRCRLVLVFTCYDHGKFPAEITILPPPQFTSADVTRWTVDVVSRRPQWPGIMATHWTKWLCAQAMLGESLDARLLYDAMDWSIKVFQFQDDSSEFLAELENRMI